MLPDSGTERPLRWETAATSSYQTPFIPLHRLLKGTFCAGSDQVIAVMHLHNKCCIWYPCCMC